MDDLISRQAMLDGIDKLIKIHFDRTVVLYKARKVAEDLPSVQPEIIRCKDCKYRDENWRRVSVKWLPCMDMRTGDKWYCGSAEREEQQWQTNDNSQCKS